MNSGNARIINPVFTEGSLIYHHPNSAHFYTKLNKPQPPTQANNTPIPPSRHRNLFIQIPYSLIKNQGKVSPPSSSSGRNVSQETTTISQPAMVTTNSAVTPKKIAKEMMQTSRIPVYRTCTTAEAPRKSSKKRPGWG